MGDWFFLFIRSACLLSIRYRVKCTHLLLCLSNSKLIFRVRSPTILRSRIRGNWLTPGPGSQEKSFSFLETVETAFPYSVIESDKVPSSIVLVCLSFLFYMGGMEIRLENHGPKTSPLRSLGWRIFLWFSCWKCFPASIPSSPTAFHSLFFYGSWRVNGKSITIGLFPLSLLYWSIR